MSRFARLVPDVLRDEPRFRLLFVGQLTSLIGDRLLLVVLPFAVLESGGDLTAVAYVVAAQTVPFLLLSLVGGVIADRGDRRRVVIVSDLARMAIQAIAAVLLLIGVSEPWHLAVLAGAYGCAEAFFAPALTGLVPQTISAVEQIQPANALRSMTYSLGGIIGPVIAGVLLAVGSAGIPLAVDAATFAVSALCMLRLVPSEVALVAGDDSSAAPPPSGFFAELRTGWAAVRSRSWVMSFLGAMVVYHVVVLPSVYVLGPVLADSELGGPSAWAAISVAFGLGTITGDLILLRWRPRFALRIAALAMAAGSCQAVIFGSGLPLGVICALETCAAIGVTMAFGLWETSLAEHIPGRELSRVSSYDYMVNAGLIPVGVIIAAPVSEAVGIHETLTVMSAIGAAAALALLLVASVRTLPRGGLGTP